MFSKLVSEKRRVEDGKVLDDLNVKYAKILDELEVKYQHQTELYLAHIQDKAMDKKNRILSKTLSEVQNQKIVKQHDLVNLLKNEVIEAVLQETSKEVYVDQFKENFKEATSKIELGHDLIVGVKPSDKALVPEGYKLMLDQDLIGGFYLIVNQTEKYDYTLNSEVLKLENYIGCLIQSLFNHTEEACDAHS